MAAVDCDPNALSESATCFNGIAEGTLLNIIAVALCNAVNGTPMNCGPNELSTAATCLSGFSYKKSLEVIAWLACQLANGGGGGGGTQVYSGHYAGAAPPDVPTGAAVAYDLDPPQNFWTWDGAAWV